MKKTLLFLIVLSLIALMMSSCTHVVYRHHDASARNIEPEHLMFTMPFTADLNVIGERISHTEIFRGVASLNEQSLENYRIIALASASKAANADIIIGALLETNFERRGGQITNELQITVTGYPAVYTNFRNIQKDDVWILDFYFPERNRGVFFPPVELPTPPKQSSRFSTKRNN